MLLKGVNKRVIVIKNPESEIFEEAYFIIRSSNIKGVFKQSKTNENEMVLEANRIISDYHNQQRSIIEKNGITGSTSIIGGDLSELDKLDNFLTGGVKNKSDIKNTISKINNISNVAGKTQKNKKDEKLSDEEILEDEKFFENMHGNTEKYGNFLRDHDFSRHADEDEEDQPHESAFRFISSKKINKIRKIKRIRMKDIPLPPKSFFVGVGFMSAVIILIRLFELIVLS